jgi:hypothetical protein
MEWKLPHNDDCRRDASHGGDPAERPGERCSGGDKSWRCGIEHVANDN